MRYRPDIDGLRAVAVLSVIIYHISIVLPGGIINRFTGGFVGVDVFFVISGYLITGIIQKQITSGNFTLRGFYARRIRRIIPAFYVVLICVSAVVIPRLYPDELIDYSKSATASMLSLSNVYFWRTAGYFDAPAETKPLLHTWSLGVEEQFYLIWPLLLMLLSRYAPHHTRKSVMILGALSFLLSAFGVFVWPDASFYLVFGRIWELALGGLFALGYIPCPKRAWTRNMAGVLGLLMIGIADLLFTKETPFPGGAALLPCVGAALVIAAGETGPNFASRVLSLKPVVFIGLISYSLYLWHWPIMVCQSEFSLFPGGSVGKIVKLYVIAATFGLATLSWRFVEQPFRHRRWTTRGTFGRALAVSILLIVIGAASITVSMKQFSAAEIQAASYLDYEKEHPLPDKCQVDEGHDVDNQVMESCLRMDPSKKNYLLLVDSHAHWLFPGLVAAYPEVNFLQAEGSGCKVLLPGEHFKRHCESMFQYLYTEFFPSHRVDGILIEGRWDAGRVEEITDFIEWAKARHIPVVVLGPMVQYDQAEPRLIAESIRKNDPAILKAHRVDTQQFEHDMKAASSKEGVPYISWNDLLCQGDSCETTTPANVPLAFDYGHLTNEGAVYAVTKLRESGQLDLVNGLPETKR